MEKQEKENRGRKERQNQSLGVNVFGQKDPFDSNMVMLENPGSIFYYYFLISK